MDLLLGLETKKEQIIRSKACAMGSCFALPHFKALKRLQKIVKNLAVPENLQCRIAGNT